MEIRLHDLNTNWYIVTDPENDGHSKGYDRKIPETAIPCRIPSIIQQYFPGYHGVAFYFCVFTPNLTAAATDRLLLRFGGVDYKAEVWLNGSFLGEYEGGETPFVFDATNRVMLGKENLLSVRVINPTLETVDGLNLMNTPHRNKTAARQAGSNLNHGGLWYGVTLHSVPAVYTEDLFLTGDIHSGKLTAQVELANSMADRQEALLKLWVRDRITGAVIGAQKLPVTAEQGTSSHEISLTVPDVRLWSTEDPYLYRVELAVESAFGCHSRSLNFGFRELTLKDGYFCLNGKRFFMKCSHTGNAFPVGQMFPVEPEMMRQDFVLAKACGFNTLRSIAGLFRPEQLDIADEIGMLVYEECFASWCMGYTDKPMGRCRFTEEDYGALVAEKGCTPVGDIARMLERFDRATENMIRRDRNHPSVVLWGLLNETYDSCIFRNAVKFLPKARALDRTRAIVLSSGRWDVDPSIGSVSLPFSDRWDHVWGEDGNPEAEKEFAHLEDMEKVYAMWNIMGDCHYYPTYPFGTKQFTVLKNLGHRAKPVFLSESGIGAQFHVIEEWKEFQARGYRQDLEDASWLAYQSRRFTEDWLALGLDAVYPFPEMMLKESQRQNADSRRTVFDYIRANPRLCGNSLSGLLDHGMCGEGLWSYWRRMKPEMFDTVSDGWAKLRFCLLCRRHVYAGEELVLDAHLANDGVLKSGEYTARFALMSETGPVLRFTETFRVDDALLAVPITRRALKLELPAGKYTLVATMDEAAPAANTLEIFVSDRNELPRIHSTVCAWGLEENTRAFLEQQGVQLQPLTEGFTGTVLVGTVEDAEAAERAARLAAGGATVLFLRSDALLKDKTLLPLLGLDGNLRCSAQREWLYGKEAVIKENTIHQGLGHGIVDKPRYGLTFPQAVFTADTYPDDVICPCFNTGYFGVKDGYGLSYAACAWNKGSGRLVFNTFVIEGNLGTPAADRLLLNYLQYLA